MHKFFIFYILIFISCLTVAACARETVRGEIADGSVVAVRVGKNKLNLKVVNTEESRMRGLSGTKSVPNDGMLFLFGDKSVKVFWMKDMNYDIDIVWLGSGKVLGITENAKHEPQTADSDLIKYYSPLYCDSVIELVAGSAKKLNIQTGDTVQVIGKR